MSVNEGRHHQPPLQIDHLGAGNLQGEDLLLASQRKDAVALDSDRRRFGWILLEGQDRAVVEDDLWIARLAFEQEWGRLSLGRCLHLL
jgi:hypothetical protein